MIWSSLFGSSASAVVVVAAFFFPPSESAEDGAHHAAAIDTAGTVTTAVSIAGLSRKRENNSATAQ